MNELKTSPRGDEVIAEVRAVREAYAARFEYDISTLFRHARQIARETNRGVVRREPRILDPNASSNVTDPSDEQTDRNR